MTILLGCQHILGNHEKWRFTAHHGIPPATTKTSKEDIPNKNIPEGEEKCKSTVEGLSVVSADLDVSHDRADSHS